MKKIFIILIMLKISNLSNAQFQYTHLDLRKILENSSITDDLFNFYFNFDHELLDKKIARNDLINLDKWKPDTLKMYEFPDYNFRLIYNYDDSGKIQNTKGEIIEANKWVNSYIEELFYDNDGRLIKELRQERENGSMNSKSRYSYVYDKCNNKIIQLAEIYENGNYVNSGRILSTFTNDCRPLTSLSQLWSDQWIDAIRESQEYDNYGNKISFISEKWNGYYWEAIYEEFFSYDSLNRLSTYIYSCTGINEIANYYRHCYFYNDSDNLINKVIDIWDNDWMHSKKYSYSYDNNENILSSLLESWENNLWVRKNKNTFSYNDMNLLVSELIEYWKNNTWMPASTTLTYYDDKNNKLSELYKKWQDSLWINLQKLNYSYDSNSNSISGKYEIWKNSSWQSEGSGRMELFSKDTEISNNWYPINFLYLTGYEASWTSTETVKVQDIRQTMTNICIFPNPAIDHITIETEGNPDWSFTITDLTGQNLLSSLSKVNRTNVDISNLPDGIYFIQIQGKDCLEVEKFIKLRQY